MSAQKDRRIFTVVIRVKEIKKLLGWVLRHPIEETGGDLFGTWTTSEDGTVNTLNIRFVLGPGKLCRRNRFSFHQDTRYLNRVGTCLCDSRGVDHVAVWHSHQSILDRPSTIDEKTVWSQMPSHGTNRFVLLIANIIGSHRENVTMKCFLFETDTKTGERMPVLQGNFRLVSEDMMMVVCWSEGGDELMEAVLEGAESLITEDEADCFDIKETESGVIGHKKKPPKISCMCARQEEILKEIQDFYI